TVQSEALRIAPEGGAIRVPGGKHLQRMGFLERKQNQLYATLIELSRRKKEAPEADQKEINQSRQTISREILELKRATRHEQREYLSSARGKNSSFQLMDKKNIKFFQDAGDYNQARENQKTYISDVAQRKAQAGSEMEAEEQEYVQQLALKNDSYLD